MILTDPSFQKMNTISKKTVWITDFKEKQSKGNNESIIKFLLIIKAIMIGNQNFSLFFVFTTNYLFEFNSARHRLHSSDEDKLSKWKLHYPQSQQHFIT